MTTHLAVIINVAVANTSNEKEPTFTGAPVDDDSDHISIPAGIDKSNMLLSPDVESSIDMLSIEGHMSMSMGLIYGCHPSYVHGVVEGTRDTIVGDDDTIAHLFMLYMSAAIVLVETSLTEAHLSNGIVSVEVIFMLSIRMSVGSFMGAITACIIIFNVIIIKKSHAWRRTSRRQFHKTTPSITPYTHPRRRPPRQS